MVHPTIKTKNLVEFFSGNLYDVSRQSHPCKSLQAVPTILKEENRMKKFLALLLALLMALSREEQA